MKNKINELNELYEPSLEKIERIRKVLFKKCIDNAILFETDLDSNAARGCVNKLVEKYSGVSAVFTGNDEKGYSFIIGSKNVDCNNIAAALRNKLEARGGGKPVMVQGSVKASREDIEKVLDGVLEV